MTQIDAINWKIGDTVARMDMVLKIDKIEMDTGEYFVEVGIWDDDAGKFQYINPGNLPEAKKIVAAVSSIQLLTFIGGVNPRSVDALINRFGI